MKGRTIDSQLVKPQFLIKTPVKLLDPIESLMGSPRENLTGAFAPALVEATRAQLCQFAPAQPNLDPGDGTAWVDGLLAIAEDF